jgi:hypothetical protein
VSLSARDRSLHPAPDGGARTGQFGESEPPWPADGPIERWPIARLIPYAKNARRHRPSQVAEIIASIRHWGWTIPVLVDERGEIIAGHARVMAARELGIVEVPVIVARGWSEAMKRSYRLADNQLALRASWNKELLKVELADLRDQAVDLELMGFAARDTLGADDKGPEGLPQAVHWSRRANTH